MVAMSHLNVSHTNNSHADDDESSALVTTPIFFIFIGCLLGALVRTILKKVRIPYTVVLLVIGCLFGLASRQWSVIKPYMLISALDPHLILYVFLPVLIFESAYAMEAHTFIKSFSQIVILAVPGLGIAAALTAVFAMYVFNYQWSWPIAMMFGSIVSATDPVAVVAVLKEVGTSKQLSILLEGESLLNDGAAIVFYNIFSKIATPTETPTAWGILLYSLQVSVGGVCFGFFMAKLTILWLVNVFNDALTEITITLASTYLTFYVGESFLGVSGVIAVVVLGVTLSSERASISPEVEVFLQRFWEMLAYLANTLIFLLVGVVITKTAISSVANNDWVLMVALYCAVNIIRAIIVAFFSPILSRIGYGLPWRNATIMVWGGLRGAVSLALALIVSHNKLLDPLGEVQDKILLHTSALVVMTLLVNATTIASLLRVLGLSDISVPKRLAMANAVRNLQEVLDSSINMYKSDRFLADADWDVVEKYTTISNPYAASKKEENISYLMDLHRKSICPQCKTEVPNEPTAKEYADMREEGRLRLLKAQKISYWKQFDNGILSREGIRKLIDLVDSAADQEGVFVDREEIKKKWHVRPLFDKVKMRLETWKMNKPTENTKLVPPRNRLLRLSFIMCSHPAFDITLYFVIFINVVFICAEMVSNAKGCLTEVESVMYRVFNFIFIAIYIFEATAKIMGFRVQYFKNHWNQFDLVILFLSIIEVVINYTLFKGWSGVCGAGTTGRSTLLSPNILRIAKGIRLLRLLRSLRLVKVAIPQIISFVNVLINRKLRSGYDIGKGYVVGQEDVQAFIDHMIDNEKIRRELKEETNEARLEIMKELGLLQKRHPGVAVSIKTQQAARRMLNKLRDNIADMKGDGVLDEDESEKLVIMVETRIKKLWKFPATIDPPPPERIIGNLSWVKDDDTLIEYIKHNAILVSMSDGEQLEAESDPKGGIYVLISGLVKVDKTVIDNTRADDVDPSHWRRRQSLHPEYYKGEDLLEDETEFLSERVTDYLTTGSVLGEMSLLTGRASDVTVTCETSTQMYHIPYDAIQAALELFTDEPSLEYRLWRVCAIRVATTVLSNQAAYDLWSKEKIQQHLDKCYIYLKKSEIPEGGRFSDNITSFEINRSNMNDLVLVHGVAENALTNEMFVGPCHIPNKVEKLQLIPGMTDRHVIVVVPRDTAHVKIERANSTSNMHCAHRPQSNTSSHKEADKLKGSGLSLRGVHSAIVHNDAVAASEYIKRKRNVAMASRANDAHSSIMLESTSTSLSTSLDVSSWSLVSVDSENLQPTNRREVIGSSASSLPSSDRTTSRLPRVA